MKRILLPSCLLLLLSFQAGASAYDYSPVHSNFLDRAEDWIGNLQRTGTAPDKAKAAMEKLKSNRPYVRQQMLADAIEYCAAKSIGQGPERRGAQLEAINTTTPNKSEASTLKIFYFASTLTADRTICP